MNSAALEKVLKLIWFYKTQNMIDFAHRSSKTMEVDYSGWVDEGGKWDFFVILKYFILVLHCTCTLLCLRICQIKMLWTAWTSGQRNFITLPFSDTIYVNIIFFWQLVCDPVDPYIYQPSMVSFLYLSCYFDTANASLIFNQLSNGQNLPLLHV